MRIIKLSQSADREAWLQQRIGKITGSKAKAVKPLSRGADKTPAGFWQLVAEKLAIAPDGEKDLERGHRLENEALKLTAEKFDLKLNLDPGMWLSDDHEDIGVSPDAAEDSDTPTYAAEAKCLSSAHHLKYVIKDLRAKEHDGYNPLNSIPDEYSSTYREQVIQYFVVNDHLKTLYFTLYDDRIAVDKYMHHVIVIRREDVAEEAAAQKQTQLEILQEVNKLIATLTEA